MSQKAEFSRSWWGKRFIEAIESFTDSNRLSRGRTYARSKKVTHFKIQNGHIHAMVKGSVNPYFGVYTEPLYTTEIDIYPISEAQWAAAIAFIATKAGFLAKLMMNEIPENIEEPFQTLGIHLLPQSRDDLETRCSCPDYINPCKHVAGVYYLVAAELDRDPFLLFELRGISRDRFRELLAASPLGKAMLQQVSPLTAPVPSEHYYSRPQVVALPQTPLKEFWIGHQTLAKSITPPTPSPISGILVKKQGDFPPFWEHKTSFLEMMDALYDRVKTKNSDIL